MNHHYPNINMAIFRQTHLLTGQQITVPKVEALIEQGPSGGGLGSGTVEWVEALGSGGKQWECGQSHALNNPMEKPTVYR